MKLTDFEIRSLISAHADVLGNVVHDLEPAEITDILSRIATLKDLLASEEEERTIQ